MSTPRTYVGDAEWRPDTDHVTANDGQVSATQPVLNTEAPTWRQRRSHDEGRAFCIYHE